jgi:cytochrome P450
MGTRTAKSEPTTAPTTSANGAGPNGAGPNGAQDASGLVELNMADPHFMANAYATYADLRARGRVVRVSFPQPGQAESTNGDETGAAQSHETGEATAGQAADEPKRPQQGFFGREAYFVTGYDDAVNALLDARLASDPRTAMTEEQLEQMEPTPEEFRPLSRSILTVDPPDHTRLRKLVQPGFTARPMEALRPRIQQIADDLLDKAERAAAERGETAPHRTMELIEAFAYPLPVKVISDMLGIPEEDRDTVRGWTENLLSADRFRGGPAEEETRAGLRDFIAYLRDLFERKRRAPRDDLISQLVVAQEDGDRLDEDELLSMVFIIFIAGHVTTVNLIGNGVMALLTHPDQLAKLTAAPELAKGVVEETLRYWGPVDFIGRRIAKEEFDLAGTTIPQGAHVMVGLASADHDATRWEQPEAYDINRADAHRHIAFGKGIHLCLGAPLARIEGQVVFSTLFRRFPELRLAVPAEEVAWGRSFLRGFAKVPLLF